MLYYTTYTKNLLQLSIQLKNLFKISVDSLEQLQDQLRARVFFIGNPLVKAFCLHFGRVGPIEAIPLHSYCVQEVIPTSCPSQRSP